MTVKNRDNIEEGETLREMYGGAELLPPDHEEYYGYEQNEWGEYQYDPAKTFEENLEQAKQQEAVITIDKLLNIETGIKELGKRQGPRGFPGPIPKHKWESGTRIRFENPDGTWGSAADMNPLTVKTFQDTFKASEGQEIFELNSGEYRMHTNSVNWYLDGIKQPNESIEELDPTKIRIRGGVSGGSKVILEYTEYMNLATDTKFSVVSKEEIDAIF